MTATGSDYNKQVVTISLIEMVSEFSPFVALQRTYIIFTGRHKFFSAFKTLLSYKILYGKQRQTKNPFLFQIPKTSASKRHQLGGRRTGPIDSLVLCSLIRDTLLGILRYSVKKLKISSVTFCACLVCYQPSLLDDGLLLTITEAGR